MSLIVEILEDGAGALPLVVAEQFDGRSKFQQLNLLIDDLILEDPHNFEAGVVRAGQETWLRTAAALLHMKIAVGLTIEQHAQLQQPLRNRWPILDHGLQKGMVVLHVPALERIDEMCDRRIFRRN